MNKPKKEKKDEFADLPVEFKDSLASQDEVEIRKKIAQVALDDEALRMAKDDDQDLHEKKTAAKDAGAQYAEGAKENRLKIKYMRRLLGDKGKPV